MRVENQHPAKNGGWMHFFEENSPRPLPPPVRKKAPEAPRLDVAKLLARWNLETTRDQITELADSLSVEPHALTSLGACYAKEHNAYAFPMYDPAVSVPIGIRLRSKDRKWAVYGSKAGLFVPWDSIGLASKNSLVLICEGPSDTAAGLSLGFFTIGRPSCMGCESMVAEVFSQLGPRVEAVIVYDNDAPGIRGAKRLAEALSNPVVRFVPPDKDLREFKSNGGTPELLLSWINNCVRTRK